MPIDIDEMAAMSDDDFMAMDIPDELPSDPEIEDPKEEEEETPAEELDNKTDEEEEENDEESKSKEAEVDEDPEEEDEEDSEDGEEVEDKEDKETTDEVDYKAGFEAIMAPFKANGKEFKVDTPKEVRQLMEMGANYNKKMATLKPNLKLMKMLQNNELLDESKLNFYIDLDKKNPEAMKKFIKDSGLDLREIDPEEETDYKPNTYAVNDAEVAIDDVLEDIKSTESYSKTVDVIANKWDAASKQTLAEEPRIIKVINDQISSGIYDQIMLEVDKAKMLGNLSGMSDIQAYQFIGNQLQEKGNLAPQKQEPNSNVVVQPDKSVTEKDKTKLNNRKKAASPTRTKKAKKTSLKDINPMEMSDEAFLKAFSGNDYL